MTIKIEIKNQQIITEKTRCIVANSVNFISAVCTFDEEWDGVIKHLIFTNGDISKSVIVTDGERFAVPHEVLVSGKLEISAVGYGEQGEKRITTKKMAVPLLVHESGKTAGDEAKDYTPELWEQIAAVIGDVAEMEVEADTLVEAINFIANAESADGVVVQKDDSGLYQTVLEQDGAPIYYLHDKKLLEQSVNVIKLTEEALYVSRDGGSTYPYEFKMKNDASESVLKALEEHKSEENPHGITAEQLGAIPAERKINGKALDKDIYLTANDVGAEVSGESAGRIAEHNISADAHNDIRLGLQELSERINGIADSDDITLDQLSEIVRYIKNNKSLIDSVTTDKVSYSDVINDLITSVDSKPLSAAQGAVLKRLVDEHTQNEENPHGVTAEQIGAAPAGMGYGERMTYYDVQDGTFETVLEEILSQMEGYSARQIQFYDSKDLHANKFIGNLWKYTANYAVLEAVCYSGIKAVKVKRGGSWYPWEYENPPMLEGTEYRTTERFNGSAVYTKLVDLGTLPNMDNITVSHGLSSSATIISAEAYATNTSTKIFQQFPIINASGEAVGKIHLTASSVMVYAFNDLSGYTGHAILKYIKG